MPNREETDTYLRGLTFAPVFLIAGTILMIWNEGHVRSQYQHFHESIGAVVNVSPDTVDSRNEGKLVHFSAFAKTTNSFSDPIFGVSRSGIVKLKRYVEMYQWDEEALTSETFEYTKNWEDGIIDSSEFEEPETYKNPAAFAYESTVTDANPIKAGAFTFTSDITDLMQWYQPFGSDISKDTFADNSTDLMVYGNSFYIGNPTSPAVGDTRISFLEVPEQVVSVIGMQTKDGLSSYETSFGGSILIVRPGRLSSKEMMRDAQQEATSWKRSLRFLALIIMLAGVKIVIEPLSVIAEIIEIQFPSFADMVYSASNWVVVYLTVCFFYIVMALCWLGYSPFFSAFLLTLVGASTQIARRFVRSEERPTLRLPSQVEQVYEMLPTDTVI